jgi:hypothetical protein
MGFLKLLTLALATVAVAAQKGKGMPKGGKGGGGGSLADDPIDAASAIAAAPAAPLADGKGCSRQALIAARDTFWQSAPAAPANLAPGAKIALNNKITPLASTPFTTLKTSTWSQLKVQAVDTEICQIATFRVSSQQVLSTRLKIDSTGSITEVEFLQAIQGDQFFRPTGFPQKEPPMFNAKQVPHAPPTIPAVWVSNGSRTASHGKDSLTSIADTCHGHV